MKYFCNRYARTLLIDQVPHFKQLLKIQHNVVREFVAFFYVKKILKDRKYAILQEDHSNPVIFLRTNFSLNHWLFY